MTDTPPPPLDDPAALAAWLIEQGWHTWTGVDAVDGAFLVLQLLDDRHGDGAAAVFREVTHRVRYRDGHPLCPGCGGMPRLVVANSQAFCGDDDCGVFVWDPRLPDGGAGNPVTIDDLIRPGAG